MIKYHVKNIKKFRKEVIINQIVRNLINAMVLDVINTTQKNFIFFKKYFYRLNLDLNSIQGIDNLELIFKIIQPNKAIITDKNNSNLEFTKNLIIWNLNQGQINSLEFSFWSLNKLLIWISIILIIIILAYLLRFYRFKLGSDLPQLPSK